MHKTQLVELSIFAVNQLNLTRQMLSIKFVSQKKTISIVENTEKYFKLAVFINVKNNFWRLR
jgi:hypothetical protein